MSTEAKGRRDDLQHIYKQREKQQMVQQATAQVLSLGYDKYFSEHSYGFRPGRSCQQAIEEALIYLNEGYEWVIDLDIEKYFDTVNHDKLVSIRRERINDAFSQGRGAAHGSYESQTKRTTQ